jgi:hypothetical protein
MLSVKKYARGRMPKGRKANARPADTVANAIRVAEILTGEIDE